MRLTAKEYMKQYKSGCEDYIMRFFTARKEALIEGGFLRWDRDPDQWSGPWMGNFVLYIVTDHRTERLLSEEEVKTKHSEYIMSSKYTYPRHVIDMCFTEEDFVCFIKGQKCSRTELTPDERREIMSHLSRQEIADLSLCVRANINHFNNVEIMAEVCKERPFKLYLCGNDDTSYSKTFATKQEALHMLDQLEHTSNWDIILNNFVFTN